MTRLDRLTGQGLVILFCLGVLIPFAALILAAINPPGTPVAGLGLPQNPTFESFAQAWTTAGFGQLLLNSAYVGLLVVPLALFCATLSGYAFATMRFRGSSLLFAFLLLGLTLPYEAAVVPLYYNLYSVGLTDQPAILALVLVGLYMPFGAFWMRQQFRSLPPELLEAAHIDGATSWVALWRVLVPCVRPALVTLGLLYFLWAWNQFLLALILLPDPSKRTAPTGLGFFVGAHTTDVPMLAAATLIVMGPIVVLFLIFQRKLIAGMLAGAVKG